MLTQKVYPVCLPSDGLRDKINKGNNNVTVTGWGDTSFGKYFIAITEIFVTNSKC